MAFEINEIGIRLRVCGEGDTKTPPAPREHEQSSALRAEIVEACVRDVLRILKATEER